MDMVRVQSTLSRPMMEMMIFPIIKALYYPDGTETHKLIGTGFFLDESGMFLSARHVFQGDGSALDLEDANGFALYCAHAVNLERKFVLRHIDVESIKTRNDSDIAAGKVELNQFGRPNEAITKKEMEQTSHLNFVSSEDVKEGTKIFTVAHPLTKVEHTKPGHVNINIESQAYEGTVTKHYPEKRDSGLLSWPCYETDMEIKGGASGGPVFISGSSGVVFAVNCTGTDPHMFSHVTSLAPLISQTVA